MSRRIAGSIVFLLGLGVSAWWAAAWLRPVLALAGGFGAVDIAGGVGAVSAGIAEAVVVPFLVFLAIRRLTARASEFARLVRLTRVGHLVVTVLSVTLGVASCALVPPLLHSGSSIDYRPALFLSLSMGLTFLPIQFFFLVSAAAIRIASAPKTM